jgi:dolichol kinase
MTRRGEFSEDTRQAVHMAMGGFAIALPLIPWFYAATFALIALIFNLSLLHRVSPRPLFRPGERKRRITSGIVLYPAAVFGLLLAFPGRPDIVAAAWGILAAGDGMASIVGRRLPIAALPWNPDKSVGGSLAFVFFGGSAGAALAWWCGGSLLPPAYDWYLIGAPFVAAAAAAAVETIPISLDDNVSVSATAGAVMWALSLVSEDLVRATLERPVTAFAIPVAANVAVATAGYLARTVTMSGAVAGAILGTTIFFFAGPWGWALLLLSFACAVVTSRMGLGRKRRLGIDEARGGRRGAGNAFANTGVAAAAAAMIAHT